MAMLTDGMGWDDSVPCTKYQGSAASLGGGVLSRLETSADNVRTTTNGWSIWSIYEYKCLY